MTSESEPNPADVVQRIAVGDLDPTDPGVRQLLAANPDVARQVDEILAVQRSLTAAGRLERDVLAEALGPKVDAVAAPRRRWPLLLAAAALLAATAVLTPMLWPSPPSDTTLGTAPRIEALARTADGALMLRWSGSLRPGDYYSVSLRRPNDDSEVARSGRLLDTAWTLPPLPGPPSDLRVEVEVLDAVGQRIAIARRDFAVPR